MGQSLVKFSPGNEEERRVELFRSIIEKYYDDNNLGNLDNDKAPGIISEDEAKAKADEYLARFYRAVSEIVEEINKRLDHTQFLLPSANKINFAYGLHHTENSKIKTPLTRGEFQKILNDILKQHRGFTGLGVKNTLIYIFGVPLTAWFIKQKTLPGRIPNDIFIPGVTSATVFALAKLNKI